MANLWRRIARWWGGPCATRLSHEDAVHLALLTMRLRAARSRLHSAMSTFTRPPQP